MTLRPSIYAGLAQAVAAGKPAQLAEIRDLRDRAHRQALIDRIEELETILGMKTAECFPAPLSGQQREILGMLITRDMRRDALIAAIYGRRPEADQPGDPDRVLRVQICRLRKRIEALGLTIHTQAPSRGDGGADDCTYFMSVTDRAAARRMIEAHA